MFEISLKKIKGVVKINLFFVSLTKQYTYSRSREHKTRERDNEGVGLLAGICKFHSSYLFINSFFLDIVKFNLGKHGIFIDKDINYFSEVLELGQFYNLVIQEWEKGIVFRCG